uniref:Lipocalin n=1 Tax=Rhipicephalus appendiculatus TaxID=34631 RepID=A0A131YBH6_RHIAP
MGLQQLSRKMDLVCVAVLLASLLSCLIYCQEAYDFRELPEKVRFMLDNTSELLNSTERLVLLWGVNGAMKDNRICWTSQLYQNSTFGLPHYIRYWTNETTKPATNFTERILTSEYYVGPQNRIPRVLLKVHGPSAPIGLSGDYILLGANPTCFVMGVVKPHKRKGEGLQRRRHVSEHEKCLYWMRLGTTIDKRKECEDAFFNNCTRLWGTFYYMRKYWNDCNFSNPTPGIRN